MSKSSAECGSLETPRIAYAWWMCWECGSVRTAKINTGWSIKLKCAECGMSTRHDQAGKVDTDGNLLPARERDYGEAENAEAVESFREICRREKFLTNNGVTIERTPSREIHSSDAGRWLFSVDRDIRHGTEHWVVKIATEATTKGHTFALADAARIILTDQRFRGPGAPGTGHVGWCFGGEPSHLHNRDDSTEGN